MPSTSSAEAPVRVRLGAGEVVVLSTVQGLVAERDRVRTAFAQVSPRAIALGISPEQAAALLRWERKDDEDPFDDIPDHEHTYSLCLGAFGAVDLPPPDLLEAARLAKENGLPLHGVDMTEETYEETYIKEVSAWQFLKYGRVQRRLAKRPPKATDARSFSLAWDAAIRKVKGLDRIETRREETMAQNAAALAAQTQGPVLLVVDHPRAAGVLARLQKG